MLDKRTLTPYLSGIDGTLDKHRECEELWRISIMKFPAGSFIGTSSLLVALIVFLRLLMVRHPMSYQRAHKPISRIGCTVAWAFPLLVSSTKLVVSLPSLYDFNLYNTFCMVVNYGLLVAPIMLTALVYVMLLCSLRQKSILNELVVGTSIADATNKRLKHLAKMTRGVVVGLIVCNVPGLAYSSYLVYRIWQEKSDKVFTWTFAV